MPPFKYTNRQAKEIDEAFKSAGFRADFPTSNRPKILGRITFIANKALAKQEQAELVRPNARVARIRPNAREAKQQLHTVSKACRSFLEALKLLDPMIERVLASYVIKRRNIDIDHKDIRALGEAAQEAATSSSLKRRFQGNGRPKNEIVHFFLNSLGTIYEDATGKRPTVSYDVYGERCSGKFYRLVQAALAPTRLHASDAQIKSMCSIYHRLFHRAETPIK